MQKIREIVFNHIAKWEMVWFGLIFWGSIFNAAAIYFGINHSPVLWYFLGLSFGVIAKIRGTWLWKI
tara:strand:- start:1013 stop:1213 length:201 start_codon:yes stop_codon:yes gene_type:complete